MIVLWLVTAYCTFVLLGCYLGHESRLYNGSKKGTGLSPYPSSTSAVCLASLRYVVPLGISRGELRLLVIARKIAVSFVSAWLVGAVAWQPEPSSE